MANHDVSHPHALPFVFEAGSVEPSSPSIIWIHGGMMSHHEYTPVLSHLPKDIYHHVLLDLPGYGVQASRDYSLEAALDDVEAAIRQNAHAGKCYIVGLSLGALTALWLLRNRPDYVEERVAKVFVTGPILEPPRFAALIILIVVPIIRLYLLLTSVNWIKDALHRATGLQFHEELAADIRKFASFERMFRSTNTFSNHGLSDCVTEKLDLDLMLCMGSKEPNKSILLVEEVMQTKVKTCQSVIAMDQHHT
jgi:pimeloyl-ACP methyl ester carboxylesterase